MKIPLPALMLSAALALSSTASTATTYNPFGVQNDVPVADVLEGGWRIIYQGLYRDGAPSVPDLFRGVCDQIMLASKRLGASKFDVLATVEASFYVPLNTARHETVIANGARWYKNDYSMGFIGLNDKLQQTSADTYNLGERDRLSWHTIRIRDEPVIRLNPGWRSGENIRLNKSDQWERFVLTKDAASGDLQSGTMRSCLPVG